jgi:DNA-binding NtrC family response regulator
MEGYGLRVLVADDCDEERVMLSELFARADYNVHVARDGTEVLRQLNKRRFDVVITRDQLPGLSSLDLVVLGQIMWPEIPIVVIAFREWGLADLALQSGAFACIRKPWDSKTFLKAVRLAARNASQSARHLLDKSPAARPAPVRARL